MLIVGWIINKILQFKAAFLSFVGKLIFFVLDVVSEDAGWSLLSHQLSLLLTSVIAMATRDDCVNIPVVKRAQSFYFVLKQDC